MKTLREFAMAGEYQLPPLLWVILLTALSAAAWAGAVMLLRWRKQRRLVVGAYLEGEHRLKEGDVAGALDVVRDAKKEVTYAGLRAPLTQIEITALFEKGDVAALLVIHAEMPDALCWQEQPAMLVAAALIADEQFEAFDKLFNWWSERTGCSPRWFLFESDKVQRQGYDAAALEVLNRVETTGDHEAGRLARLALLRDSQDEKDARSLMECAVQLAPQDAGVRILQGMFHEKYGRVEVALGAFQSALSARPCCPLTINAAGEFYRRSGNTEQALAVWMGGLKEPSLDQIWLKVLFLRRVYRPIEPDWDRLDPPPGDGRRLIDFIRSMSSGRFWDAEAFQPIAAQKPLLLSRQEVHWLRILEALRIGDEGEALSLLNLGRFGERSWNQDLETALIWILTYRRLKFMNPDLMLIADKRLRVAGRHPLFSALDDWVHDRAEKVLPFVKRLVVSDEAFAAACMAAGFHRAGLLLHRVPPVRSEAPDWLVRDYEAALRACRSEAR